MKINKVEFNISYEEISDIMNYITDEFPELEYNVESSSQSSIIYFDEKSFIITLQNIEGDIHTLPVLHYIEPKVFELIDNVESQLKQHGFYVFFSDFGQTDQFYELVICQEGHNPTSLPRKKIWEGVKKFKDLT